MTLAHAPAINRIALSDVRLLKEAQQGNPNAFEELMEPHLGGIWSICRAHAKSQDAALEQVSRFRDRLRRAIRGFAADKAFGMQLYRLLWTHLHHPAEPFDATGIQIPMPRSQTVPPPSPDRIEQVLRDVHPTARLLYLFWLVTDLDAGLLADLTGQPEGLVRAARTHVTARLRESAS